MKIIWKTLTCKARRIGKPNYDLKGDFDIDAFDGQLPLFQAPIHRFAICTEDGRVFYENVSLDEAININKYIRHGIYPTIEDLGPV